jgi:hypothetical protein
MSDDFKDYPPTIGELRSDKSHAAKDWSPRDALVSLLREIDGGSIKPTAIFICGVEASPEGDSWRPFYRNASASPAESLGVIELAKDMFMLNTRE